jgi:hypothetical protein
MKSSRKQLLLVAIGYLAVLILVAQSTATSEVADRIDRMVVR